MHTTTDRSWMVAAHCRDLPDYDAMFPRRAADQMVAARHCADCPVRRECLSYALRLQPEHGVWGGLTERQLRSFRRRMAAA